MELEVINQGCGGCTACCRVIGVRELGKPYYFPCEHQSVSGCKIYSNRPESCRGFECFWLIGAMDFERQLRPDRFGFVITIGEEDSRRNLHAYATKPLSQITNENCEKLVDILRKLFIKGNRGGLRFQYIKFSVVDSGIGAEYDLVDQYPKTTERCGNLFMQTNVFPEFLLHIPKKYDTKEKQSTFSEYVFYRLFGIKTGIKL